MRFKLVLTALLSLAVAGLAGARAEAANCTQQTVWTSGLLMVPANLNADPVYLYGTCLKNLDKTNVGPVGFTAAQLIPTTVAEATFGGAQPYVFPNGIVSGVPISSTGFTSTQARGTVAYTYNGQGTDTVGIGNTTTISAGGIIGTEYVLSLNGATGLATVDTSGNMGLRGAVSAQIGEFGGLSSTAPAGRVYLEHDGSNALLRVGTGGLNIQNGDGSSTFVLLSNTAAVLPGTLTANNGVVVPTYDLTGNSVSITTHAVRVAGTLSGTTSTCGPFANAYCATVPLPASRYFGAVSTSSTPFDCGGGETLAANNYWLHDFVQFAVEWNTGTTIYVAGGAANVPFSFLCQGG